MRIQGQPEGARRCLELNTIGELRTVEVIRGRAGYGFTIAGQRPCLLRGILDGSPADIVGLKHGDRIMAINGTDVSSASHETVVQLIGTCKGLLQLVVHTEGRIMGNPILIDAKFGIGQKSDIYEKKACVLRTISDDSNNSSFNSSHAVTTKQRPVSEPDMSQWSQHWSSLAVHPKEETSRVGGPDSLFMETEDVSPVWNVLNMTLVVGYLSSTELILNATESEEDCLKSIRERIRELGTEQDTHTLVLMKIMFNCIRLCDDTGAVLAAFPAENLVLGAVCAEDPRFFCLVTTAHIFNGRIPDDGPLRTSCHVFFIDPDLGSHEDHMGIAGRFGFGCTPDPDALGCLEFPQTPPDVLHFVTVLYSDMGEAVERLRSKLDLEAEQQTKENGSTGKQGSSSSNGDSGIGNASPPIERADGDFPSAIQNHPGPHLPSCRWDYAVANDLKPINLSKNDQNQNNFSIHSLSESLPGPDSLTSFYGGPPPRLEFQFKPPPPPLPLGRKTNFFGDPFRSSQRWFSKPKWPKALSDDPEPQVMSSDNWSPSVSLSSSTTNLPPPMNQIPSERYQSGDVLMLPPREDWTKRFLEQREKQRKDESTKNGSRFWGMGFVRGSKRRSAKRLSLARSLDDLESAASSDGDYSGVQLQGCCSQSSLNSNGSLPGAGSHRGVPEQRVASWAACFERLLQDPVGVRYFSEFLKKEFSEENILFWQACEYFSHVPASDKKQLSQRAGEIYNSFLSSKATMPVNIDSQAQLADDVLTSPQPDMFKTQQLQIFNLMKFDSYSRFLKSSLYQECMRAEVDGQPLPDPYQIPCSPAPSKHSASSDRSTLSTPKKEARKQRSGRSPNEDSKEESADKKRGIFFSWSRNRSFGKGPKKKEIGDINLDYWGSNGRRESQGSLSSGTSLEMATSCSAGKIESDNRHSLGVWERSPKHCSVILPDGSCSSISLRPGASIREVLQDLCHNISVNIAAVDLFLVGGEKPLVLDQDCMTLSSRDLRLEKRTLFRLDLVPINRSVGLKAKPTKPVTEVLRPVVAKYGLHLSELVAKISGETEPLDLGAPISSLDGLRVVLERADPASGKDKSKSSSLKGHPPTRSFSAAGDERSTPKDFSVRASGPDSGLPGEKRKQKKINIDEAEEFFELLSRAQSSRANDQRGLLNKEDLVLPDSGSEVPQVCSRLTSFTGSMNSLPGRAALLLCRRTAPGGMGVLGGSSLHPAGGLPADRASFQAVRVCHSGTNRKSSVSTKKRGYDITRNPHLNKGMAFTLEERLQLGIHGLLPPCFLSQDVQVLRVMKSYETRTNPLDKYILLMTLQDRNEKLFYRLLTSDIEEFMPIVYTPTVGLACQQYGLAFRRPRGLFITIHDRGHIATMLNSWPEEDIKAIVVTDGERILGLGDLGSYGMGIPVGKLALYTACGGVRPQQCLPVLLDVGTDNQTLLNDPLYIGLKHKRIRGKEYDELIDEFMQAVTDKYGMNCLIQFEDFANSNAFRILNKYRNRYCTFNDDIQGTASVAVAGILAALKITKNKLLDHTFVFQGAGEAALGIAHLIMMAMAKEGVTREEAAKRIWMVDSKGLIVKGRSHLNHEKEEFAHDHPHIKTLEEVVHTIKPTAIIGVAAIGGAFTEKIIKDMASSNERPIIFALSNPTSKAECTAEQCYKLTEGRGIFASGSPFDKVTLADGRSFYPGQGNNAYVFPGVALGIIACGVRHISEDIFLTTAEAIADMVTEENLAEGRLYPPLNNIREVSFKIALKVVDYAYKHNLASVYPEPKDKEAFVLSHIYSPDYDSFSLDTYTWPQEAMAVQDV